MSFAWYGHLKFKSSPLWLAILASWGIAFFEYCLQVPANRIGHTTLTAPQLKVIQEVITFLVFGIFSWKYLGEQLTWHDRIAFVMVIGAAFVSLYKPKFG